MKRTAFLDAAPSVPLKRPSRVRTFALAFCLWLAWVAASGADENTPVGRWRTVDDKTGHAKSVVEISETNGELSGKVVEILESAYGPDPVCVPCQGDRKDKPVKGMTILWGVRQNADGWTGGNILDPENGKIYDVLLRPLDGGKRLEVHGYLGVTLVGRSQKWERVNDSVD